MTAMDLEGAVLAAVPADLFHGLKAGNCRSSLLIRDKAVDLTRNGAVPADLLAQSGIIDGDEIDLCWRVHAWELGCRSAVENSSLCFICSEVDVRRQADWVWAGHDLGPEGLLKRQLNE